MDILATPDVYEPTISIDGQYVDYVPSFQFLNNGLRCPCSNHGGYKNATSFRKHIESQKHRTWLETINANKHNIYVENENLKLIVEQQRQQLIEKERAIRDKESEIRILTRIVEEKMGNLNTNVNMMFLD